MAEMLVVGTFWFWVILAVEFFVLIWCLEYERYLFAPVTLAALLVGLYFFGNLADMGRWIWDNPWWATGYFGGYFVVGAIYTLVKWWTFSYDIREKNREEKKSWLSNWKTWAATAKNNLDSLQKNLQRLERDEKPWNYEEQKKNFTEEIALQTSRQAAFEACNGAMTVDLLPFWKDHEQETWVNDWFGRRVSIAKPEPENYKGRIIAWIVYWPPSMFWTLLNDPIRKLGRQIYYRMAGTLKRISDSVWKDEDNVG